MSQRNANSTLTAATGKSSLVIQFVEDHFQESYYPTIETTFTKTVTHNGVEYECDIIDTAGQVRPSADALISSHRAQSLLGRVFHSKSETCDRDTRLCTCILHHVSQFLRDGANRPRQDRHIHGESGYPLCYCGFQVGLSTNVSRRTSHACRSRCVARELFCTYVISLSVLGKCPRKNCVNTQNPSGHLGSKQVQRRILTLVRVPRLRISLGIWLTLTSGKVFDLVLGEIEKRAPHNQGQPAVKGCVIM